MLHIILLILKIIGITILVILGLLLLILFTALLVPVRYRVLAEHGEKFYLDGKATWLLSLFGVRVTHLEGIMRIRIRILFFTLYDSLKQRKPRIKKEKKASGKKKNSRKKLSKTVTKKDGKSSDIKEVKPVDNKNQRIEETKKQSSISEKSSEIAEIPENHKTSQGDHHISKEARTLENVPYIQEKTNASEDEPHIREEDNTQEDKVSFFQKIKNKMIHLKDKIVKFFTGLKDKIVKSFQTIKNLKNKSGLIFEFIQDEYNKEGFSVTFESLKKLLKHMLPTKLQSRVVFGTGDPCSTGQALGVIGALYGIYGDKIQVIPDFENKILEGKHYARGRIRLITILIIVIKLILDKRFKKLKTNFQILKEAL